MTQTENKKSLDTNAGSSPNVELTYRDLENAARCGDIERLRWLVEQDEFGFKLDQGILQSAVWSLKTADIPQWLIEQGRKLDKDIFDKDFLDLVAFAGKLNVVRWSIDRGVKPDMETLNNAAHSGNLEVLQFLIKQGQAPNRETLEDAAESGSLETVKWLVEQYGDSGLKPDQVTLNTAAGSKGLELVQWLVAHGDEFGLKPDQDTVDRAAGHENNWDILLWLIDQGLKPDIEILREATSESEWYMVQSLIKRGAVRPTQQMP